MSGAAMNQMRKIDADLAGKTVLLRANLTGGVTGELADAVRSLAARGARVAIIAGFGSPAGEHNPALSLKRFATAVDDAAGVRVTFIADCVGPVAEAGLHRVPFGEAALLENLRFHADERRDSRSFAIRLSVLADHFAILGPLPDRPRGWLTELALLLPAPGLPPLYDAPTTTAAKEL